MSDPSVRKDGTCAQCGKPRTMPKTHHRDIAASVYANDPWCSAICCRAFHGNPTPKAVLANHLEKRGRRERVPA
jgi:hypothetical protein